VRSLTRFAETQPVAYHNSSRNESHNGLIMRPHKPSKTAEWKGAQRALIARNTSNVCAIYEAGSMCKTLLLTVWMPWLIAESAA
jgi:hypothetical protein